MLLVPAAYVIGCFCTGYYLVRFRRGQDIRSLGSGGVGAKNVLRVLGPAASAVTVLTDMGKGAIVAAIARHQEAGFLVTVLALVAVVAGHVWPAQLNFRGGKGVATAGGALAVLDPAVAASWIAVYLLVFAFCRRSTLSGLLTVCLAPGIGLLTGCTETTFIYLLTLIPIILFSHRKNISEIMMDGA